MLMIEPPPCFSIAGTNARNDAMHRLDIEVEGEIPVLLRTFQHAALMHEAGAVGENVGRAEFPDDVLGERIDLCGRAHVELANSSRLFSPLSLPASRSVAITLGTFGDKCFRDGAADALARPP